MFALCEGGGHKGVANDHKGIAKNHLSCACLYPGKDLIWFVLWRFWVVLAFHSCCNLVRICVPAEVIGDVYHMYSKTCVKRPLKDRQNKDLNDNWLLMKVKSIAECSTWSILQYF